MKNKKLSLILPSIAIGLPSMIPSACAAPVPEPAAGKEEEQNQDRLNVLMIVVDDLRPELNCYGASYMKTPNIDKFAASGILFENAYCNVPVSGASRASLFSGLRPGNTRYWDVNAEIDVEAPGNITLPQYFRENGYVTIANSKVIHGKDDARERSWDESWYPELKSSTWRDYLGDENLSVEKQKGGPAAYECLDVDDSAYSDGKTADKTIEDLRTLAESGKPFFLAAGILKPHLPFNAPAKYWNLYPEGSISLPETFEFDRTGFPQQAFHTFGEIRYYKNVPAEGGIPEDESLRLIRGYRAAVSYSDAQIGRILDELERLGLDKNTVVILIGDHGWSLGDHGQWCKHSNFDIVTNAPMILRIPGNKRTGKEEKVVEFVDIYPTLCEAAGLPVPAHTEGESMVALAKGKDRNWKDCAIVKWHSGVTYVDRKYAYTIWKDKKENYKAQMLFLHESDPDETKNVAESPEYKTVIENLRQEILDRRGKDFMKETAQPVKTKKQ